MKQKDLALILVIMLISAIFSFVLSRAIFAPPANRQQQVEVVEPITSEFVDTSSSDYKDGLGRYYNQQSLNPTQQITIGENNNPAPFNGTSQ